jgi:hypothetical protein
VQVNNSAVIALLKGVIEVPRFVIFELGHSSQLDVSILIVGIRDGQSNPRVLLNASIGVSRLRKGELQRASAAVPHEPHWIYLWSAIRPHDRQVSYQRAL